MIKELQKKLLGKDTYNEQMIEALKRYIREQQKEIEDLKEQVEYQDLWRKEYRDRIDKAIEEINKRSSKEVAKLYIDILKGGNNE